MQSTRSSFLACSFATLLVLSVSACGGGGDNGNPGAPSPPPGPSGTTVNIVGDRAAQSFTPNPANAVQGQNISWRNTDNQIHRIVFNDGSFDSGDIAPGATSAPRALPTNGANYHCSLHPGMIGSISGSSGAPPPCTGIYC